MTMPPSETTRGALEVKMRQWKMFRALIQSITKKAVEVQARTLQGGTFERKGRDLEKEALMADERRCKLPFHSRSVALRGAPASLELGLLSCH